MIIYGKEYKLAEISLCNNTKTSDYIWVGYDDSEARLPVAIAPTADALAEIMGVKRISVETNWCKFRHGELKSAKYAKVYIGDSEDE